jgi:ubiquinone/menaquinone biosynthesis C-methylase UbiE
MSLPESEVARITAEYDRRSREIPVDFYSWQRPANLLKDQQIARSCIRLLHRADMFPLDGKKVVDVGCGVGTWLLEFLQWGADPVSLAGLDLMPDRVARTLQRIPEADIRLGNAGSLPWESASFDIASQFMMFTNLFDDAAKRTASSELLRVVKPGGVILWLDMRYNNPRNPQMRAIGPRELRTLFPGCAIAGESVMLASPLSRAVTATSWTLAEALHVLPFLRSHYAAVIRKPQ